MKMKSMASLCKLVLNRRCPKILPTYVALCHSGHDSYKRSLTPPNDLKAATVNNVLDKRTDMLNEMLKQVSTASQLNEIITKESKSIGEANVLTALSKFVLTHEADFNDGGSASATADRHELSILCDRLVRCSWTLEPEKLVTALYSLVRLNLSPKTVVVQTVLELVRRDINHLTLGDIIRLSHILKKVERTPLVTAIHQALPMVFRNRLAFQMDVDNIKHISEAFCYACRHNLPIRDLHKLTNVLQRRQTSWRAKDAESVLWGLALTKHPLADFGGLIDAAAETLSRDVGEVSSRTSLLRLLQRLAGKNYSNEGLLRSAERVALSEEWSFGEVHSLALLSARFLYFRVPFFNFYVETALKQIALDPATIPIVEVLTLLSGTGVRSPRVELLLDELAPRAITWSEDALRDEPHETIKLAISLELNRRCSAPIISRFDVASLLINDTSENYVSVLKDCLFLGALANVKAWQDVLAEKLRTNLSRYVATVPQERTNFPLAPALNAWFGTSYTVLSGYTSRTGIFVDHLLLPKISDNKFSDYPDEFLESLRYPNQTNFAENCATASNFKPLAVLVNQVYPHSSAVNQILKSTGFSVMEVSLTGWNSLFDHERQPYLERALQEAVEHV